MKDATCHPDMPVVSKRYFANFTPDAFALIAEGLILPYIIGYLPSPEAGIPWAAVRAVERGEVTCPALAVVSSRKILKYHISWARDAGQRKETLTALEKEYAFFHPSVLPRIGGLSVDFHKTVTGADLLAAVFQEGMGRSWAYGPWEKEGHATEAIRAYLLAPGGFVVSQKLIDRGCIPSDKQAIYQRACELAAYHGLWLIRKLEVEMAAIQLGLSNKDPQQQQAIQRQWDESIRCAREHVDASYCCPLVSFPGPRPWALSATEALRVDVPCTAGDRQAWPAAHELPDLRAQLKTDDLHKLWWTTVCIGRLGAEAAPAVPDLVKLLKDDSAIVRKFSAEALGDIGPTGKGAVSELVHALKDPAPDVIYSTLSALSEIGLQAAEAVPTLLGMLKDRRFPWRGGAAKVLGRIGTPDGAVVVALCNIVKHEAEAELRVGAIEGLSRLGADKERTVPVLIEALGANELDVRRAAVSALAECGPDALQAVPELISMVETKELPGEQALAVSALRGSAAYALGEIGPAASKALDALVKAYREDNSFISYNAMVALASLGPVAKKVVPILVEQLNSALHPGPGMIRPFGLLRELARPAIPRLLDILFSEKGMSRTAAACALGEIGDDEIIVDALWAAATTDFSRTVRAAVASVLGKVAPDQISRLRKALADELDELLAGDELLGKLHAAHAIARLEDGDRGVNLLIGVASDRNAMCAFRQKAARSLGELGPLAKSVLPSLRDVARERDPSIRSQAKRAIRDIESG